MLIFAETMEGWINAENLAYTLSKKYRGYVEWVAECKRKEQTKSTSQSSYSKRPESGMNYTANEVVLKRDGKSDVDINPFGWVATERDLAQQSGPLWKQLNKHNLKTFTQVSIGSPGRN